MAAMGGRGQRVARAVLLLCAAALIINSWRTFSASASAGRFAAQHEGAFLLASDAELSNHGVAETCADDSGAWPLVTVSSIISAIAIIMAARHMDSLEQSMQAEQKSAQELQKKLEASLAENLSLQSQLGDAQRTNRSLSKESRSLYEDQPQRITSVELTVKEQQLAAAKKNNEQLASDLQAAERKLTTVSGKAEESANLLKASEEKLAVATRRMQKSDDDRKLKEQELKLALQRLAQTQSKLDVAQKQATDTQTKLSNLEDELAVTKQKLQQSEAEVNGHVLCPKRGVEVFSMAEDDYKPDDDDEDEVEEAGNVANLTGAPVSPPSRIVGRSPRRRSKK